MKKIFSVLIVLSVCLCFAACGRAGTGDADVTTQEAAAPADIAGEYYVFAVERDGYRIAATDFGESEDGKITLDADGSGSMMTGDTDNSLSWTRSGNKLVIMDGTGAILLPITVTILSDGVLSMQDEDDKETGYFTYFAKIGADTSAIETISAEEYWAMTGQ